MVATSDPKIDSELQAAPLNNKVHMNYSYNEAYQLR